MNNTKQLQTKVRVVATFGEEILFLLIRNDSDRRSPSLKVRLPGETVDRGESFHYVKSAQWILKSNAGIVIKESDLVYIPHEPERGHKKYKIFITTLDKLDYQIAKEIPLSSEVSPSFMTKQGWHTYCSRNGYSTGSTALILDTVEQFLAGRLNTQQYDTVCSSPSCGRVSSSLTPRDSCGACGSPTFA